MHKRGRNKANSASEFGSDRERVTAGRLEKIALRRPHAQ